MQMTVGGHSEGCEHKSKNLFSGLMRKFDLRIDQEEQVVKHLNLKEEVKEKI